MPSLFLTLRICLAWLLFSACIESRPAVAADDPLSGLLQKRVAKLELQFKELTARIGWLETKLTATTDEKERERLQSELTQAGRDAAKAKEDLNYFRALGHIESGKADLKRIEELKLNAGKTQSTDEKAELTKEIAELRRKSDAANAEAGRIMRELAPIDRTGYGRAHLWLVQQLYRFSTGADGKLIPPTSQNIQDAERHLIHALESPSADDVVGAHFGLAKLYRDTNRIAESKKHLIEVAKRHPEYRLTLAQWAKQENESKDAIVAHAQAAESEFAARIKVNVDDHEARFGLVDCLILQERFEEAQFATNKGATLATEAELVRAYARKMSSMLAQWSDSEVNNPTSTLAERLKRLEQALQLDPDNPDLFNRLLKLTKTKGPDADKAREVFRKLIADNKGSAMAHLFLGIDAWQQDNAKEAKQHWEKAFELSQGAPVIANNLAWVLAFSPPIDLPRALELANAAVTKVPNEPRFRGTRGHILAQLGRDNEALPDLEEAIKVYPNDANLFKVLAEVCKRLGLDKKSEQYRSEYNRLGPMKPASDVPMRRPGDA